MSIFLYFKQKESLFYTNNTDTYLLKSKNVTELSTKLMPFIKEKSLIFHYSRSTTDKQNNTKLSSLKLPC